MPGSITPLPVLAELDAEDRKLYEQMKPPSSIVVRYGAQKMIAELPYDGEVKLGCGSKVVIRSPRGMELAEMLTTTCSNSGCSKSVSRQEMLRYIDNSGGKQYPFTTSGRVLRVATVDDLNQQAHLDAERPRLIKTAQTLVRQLDLDMKVIDVESLLGGERLIFHFVSEQRIDFRELVRLLAAEYHTRIEMHQVNAREEARLVADYEKCGQHCCCKQFLKVLKPISMRSAKVQKATLDPAKISGRCGRLMCCLRYEDETYEELRKKLPHRKSRWITADGPGTVLDTQILTQLALIKLDSGPVQAYPIESLEKVGPDDRGPPPPPPPPEARPPRTAAHDRPRPAPRPVERHRDETPDETPPPVEQEPMEVDEPMDTHVEPTGETSDDSGGDSGGDTGGTSGGGGGEPRRRRRRRRRGRRPDGPPPAAEGPTDA